MTTLDWQDFREMSVPELVTELDAHGALEPGDFHQIVVEVQDPDGKVIATNLVQLHVGVDGDFDRIGSYRWVKLTVRMEQ
jgi:hypothetical protein